MPDTRLEHAKLWAEAQRELKQLRSEQSDLEARITAATIKAELAANQLAEAIGPNRPSVVFDVGVREGLVLVDREGIRMVEVLRT